jgi:protein-S-isoprenylcysteine O-methyltransferase Ste14
VDSTGVELKARPFAAGIAATILSVVVLVANLIADIDEPGWLTGIGLACLALAVVLAVPPFFLLRRYGMPRTGDAFYATTHVVDKSVYSLVRHPQYLGYSLLVLGFACLDPHWIAIACAVGASALFYKQAILEERFCCRELGADYVGYSKRVPRFNILQGLLRFAKSNFR